MKNREKYRDEIIGLKKDGDICEFFRARVLPNFGEDCDDESGLDCEACRVLFALWLDDEYQEPEVDWSKVKVDTPILVRDNEYETPTRRYFAKYENGIIYAWVEGGTSWTQIQIEDWKYAKLAEDGEKE